jgi:hypothetical protein
MPTGRPPWAAAPFRVAAALSLLAAAFFAPALLGGRVLAPPGDGILYY